MEIMGLVGLANVKRTSTSYSSLYLLTTSAHAPCNNFTIDNNFTSYILGGNRISVYLVLVNVFDQAK